MWGMSRAPLNLAALLTLAALLATSILLTQVRSPATAAAPVEATGAAADAAIGDLATLHGRVLVDDAFPASLYRIELQTGDRRAAPCPVPLDLDGGFRLQVRRGQAHALSFSLVGTDGPLRVLANVGRRPGPDPRLAAVELRDELSLAHLEVVDVRGRALRGVRVVELVPEGAPRRLVVRGEGPVDLHARGRLPAFRVLCEGYEPCDLRGVCGHVVVVLADAERIG